MRISELARTADVPLATVKFYLREGLLPEGRRTSATQAQYGEAHLERLRLIRALAGPGGLSLAAVRRVVGAIEHPPDGVHELLGVATAAVDEPLAPRDHTAVHALLTSWGWAVQEKDCPSHDQLAAELAALDDAGFALPEGALDAYRRHMEAIATLEVDSVPTGSAAAAVRHVVLGTVLVEPLLLTLRRLAHQELSARRFG
ncbi:MerR family transcriptional regulator [Friedmanniella luteola]|uniref:MerR family transcriptional regulator n=1 Tax=Friedmanniella luteola TaxID=546871 RepID=UPI000AE22C9F|nr:MerR family transcriptional regulator [Friedmanniella luteola]